ncbi:MAG: hypothetical protein J5I98_35355 [Phaeodactylibacter sp.]|nr:hypothetical protein [Phaeodactylibacter sp.]
MYNDERCTAVRIMDKNGKKWDMVIANQKAGKEEEHQLEIDGKMIKWKGPLALLNKNFSGF